jgi:monothiol glutaredoxin
MSAEDTIKQTVTENDVVLFMKGTKMMPQCGFSSRVAGVLNYMGVEFADVNVLADDAIRQGIKDYSDWPTIPQLYVKGEFVGGCDIITEMTLSGELDTLFEENGVAIPRKPPTRSAKPTPEGFRRASRADPRAAAAPPRARASLYVRRAYRPLSSDQWRTRSEPLALRSPCMYEGRFAPSRSPERYFRKDEGDVRCRLSAGLPPLPSS